MQGCIQDLENSCKYFDVSASCICKLFLGMACVLDSKHLISHSRSVTTKVDNDSNEVSGIKLIIKSSEKLIKVKYNLYQSQVRWIVVGRHSSYYPMTIPNLQLDGVIRMAYLDRRESRFGLKTKPRAKACKSVQRCFMSHVPIRPLTRPCSLGQPVLWAEFVILMMRH